MRLPGSPDCHQQRVWPVFWSSDVLICTNYDSFCWTFFFSRVPIFFAKMSVRIFQAHMLAVWLFSHYWVLGLAYILRIQVLFSVICLAIFSPHLRLVSRTDNLIFEPFVSVRFGGYEVCSYYMQPSWHPPTECFHLLRPKFLTHQWLAIPLPPSPSQTASVSESDYLI